VVKIQLARTTANRARSEKADAFALNLKSTLDAFKASGMPQLEMCVQLNKTVPARRGGQWSQKQVQRVLKRLEAS